MSTYPTTINSPRQNAQRGSVALIALVALVVVFIIGLGLLTLGSNARLSGKRAMRLNGAQAMAAAGVEYGDWQRFYNGQPLPFTSSRSLGNGKFIVTVTDNNANAAGTMQIVSTGTQSGDSVKLTRILPVKKTVFDYALCSGSTLSTGQKVITGSSGSNGDVGANGSIYLTGSGTVVNGNATATTGSINIKSITGTKTPNSAAIAFPAISPSSYQNVVATYGDGQTFSGTFALPPPSNGLYPVVIINGSATINAVTVSGVGTVVVNGNMTFTGGLSCPNSGDKIAILCTGNIINAASIGTAIEIDGFYYAHNSSGGTAAFQQSNTGTLTIKGGLAADSYTVNGPLVSIHDPWMNATHASQMQLPGY